MHNMVFKVFKTIAFAIIFVFVFDILFYIYRFASFNTKVENITTSLQKVVMENNYLPAEQAELFKAMFYNMMADYNAPTRADRNGYHFNSTVNTVPFNTANNAFVLFCDWNYGNVAVFPAGTSPINVVDNPGHSIVHNQMGITTGSGEVGDYGDIMIVQVRFILAQPMWNFMHSSGFIGAHRGITAGATANGFENQNETTPAQKLANRFTTEVDYNYYVPCLQYKSITQ